MLLDELVAEDGSDDVFLGTKCLTHTINILHRASICLSFVLGTIFESHVKGIQVLHGAISVPEECVTISALFQSLLEIFTLVSARLVDLKAQLWWYQTISHEK